MSTTVESPLFKTLLGNRGSLDAAIQEASARIAAIGQRNNSRSFRSVKVHGASVTHLYDYELPARKVTTGEKS